MNADDSLPAKLPEIIPVFPLPSVLLLPRGRLPLNQCNGIILAVFRKRCRLKNENFPQSGAIPRDRSSCMLDGAVEHTNPVTLWKHAGYYLTLVVKEYRLSSPIFIPMIIKIEKDCCGSLLQVRGRSINERIISVSGSIGAVGVAICVSSY